MHWKFFGLVLVLMLLPILAQPTGLQSIRVTGKLMCGNEPASETLITLFEENEGKPSSELAHLRTSSDGSFDISGSKSESDRIHPYLRVLNMCNSTQSTCQRHWRFELNNLDLYINSGKVPEKSFDIGTFNLDEKRCGADGSKLQTVIHVIPK